MIYSKIMLENKAKVYIQNKLKDGKELSQQILHKSSDFVGNFYTFHSNNLKFDELYAFDRGRMNVNKECIHNYFDEEVSHFLTNENSIVVFEKSLFTKANLPNLKHKSNFLIYKTNLFYYLLAEQNSLQKIDLAFRESSCAWQNLFFFSTLPKEYKIESHDEISSELIRIIAENTVKIFCDAYDQESYVVWDLE